MLIIAVPIIALSSFPAREEDDLGRADQLAMWSADKNMPGRMARPECQDVASRFDHSIGNSDRALSLGSLPRSPR
jgi:hypothetical protein